MPEYYLNTSAAAAGLYVHIPFCLSKCDYCAFNSYPVNRHAPAAYIKALKKQVRLLADYLPVQSPLTVFSTGFGNGVTNHPFDTVYLGGGTPTCLETDLLLDLLNCLKNNFRLEVESEITIEANPNSICYDGLARLTDAGVNRISLGVQSFSEPLLEKIGRGHSAEDIYLGVEKIRKAGPGNLGLDLIFGLPGQDLQDFRESLESALNLNPQHLSLYELMVEKNTPLAGKVASGRLSLPDEDLVAEMAEAAREICRKNGFKQYEIANFAKEGFSCRHNLHYWHNHTYLGLGAGAVSGWQGLRITCEPDPDLFIARLNSGVTPVTFMEGLCRQASFRETVIMGLRMIKGVSIEYLQKNFQISPLNYYGEKLAGLLDMDLIEIRGDRLRLTEKGLPVANRVLSSLV
ncbi:MAG: radical SAM family heme chaperone HemW [Thermodesulfobacteriota bacterium]